jgi:hypothetical protein
VEAIGLTVICRARVWTIADSTQDGVTLELVQTPEGWTYTVAETRGGPLHLIWRAKTPESATRKRQGIYDPRHWRLAVMG